MLNSRFGRWSAGLFILCITLAVAARGFCEDDARSACPSQAQCAKKLSLGEACRDIAPGCLTGEPVPEEVAEEILQLREHLGDPPLEHRDVFSPPALPAENLVQAFGEGEPSDGPQPLPRPEETPCAAMKRDEEIFKDALLSLAASRPIDSLPPAPPAGLRCANAGHREHRINVLRESALQLGETAHLLECLDLYERADQVRSVAEQLRHDARELRRSMPRHAIRPVYSRPACECY